VIVRRRRRKKKKMMTCLYRRALAVRDSGQWRWVGLAS
jgi:hypothetical protein